MNEEVKKILEDLIKRVLSKSDYSLTATQITHRIANLVLEDLVGELSTRDVRNCCLAMASQNKLVEQPKIQPISTFKLTKQQEVIK